MEEEAGFQKVPEDDSTTTSRASCLQELPWDKVDFSAVQFCSLSFIWDGHSVNLDKKQILIFIINCQQSFLLFFFHYYYFWLTFFSFKSVMVQTESSLFLFFFCVMMLLSLVFLSPWIFKSPIVLNFSLVVMLHPSKELDGF